MSAWTVKKLWGASEIAQYREFVAKRAPGRVGALRSTCEDLALRLVIEFAEKHNLPVGFHNGANKSGLTPDQFANTATFTSKVLTSTGASDLLTFKTVKLVPGTAKSDSSSLKRASKGDLIILYPGGGHVQMVTAANATTVTIVQGNFRPSSERHGRLSRWWNDRNQNRPSDPSYIGAIVAQKAYKLDTTTMKWIYNGDSDIFSNDEGQLVIWDFAAFNKLAVKTAGGYSWKSSSAVSGAGTPGTGGKKKGKGKKMKVK